MKPSDILSGFIRPLLPGWRFQFGAWRDDSSDGAAQFAVLKPAGGGPISILREPFFTLMLIGAKGTDAQIPLDAAEAVIAAMRADDENPMFMQPSEPVFHPTSDGRPAYELTISTITD